MMAFDECSILHMYQFSVPLAYVSVYGNKIKHENYQKLLALVDKIMAKGDIPYRFVPGLGRNVSRAVFGLLGGVNIVMEKVFFQDIKLGLQRFWDGLKGWGEIQRVKDCDDVLEVFKANEKELKKAENIPEHEDCEIIKAYKEFNGDDKMLVSEDEHFWGYKELIKTEFGINVVEERECDKVG